MILQKVLSEWSFGKPLVTNMLVRSKKAVWKMAKLFKSGAPGFDFQPSDLSTLYQDSAGTTPVDGMEQPVGLMLDKSLSSTFVATTDATWAVTQGDGVLTVSGNQITVTGATTTTHVTRTSGTIPFVPGLAKMVVRADFTDATGVNFWVRGVPQFALHSGVSTTLTAPLNNSNIERFDVVTGTVTFTIESFGYWQGNHATQPTSSKQPLVTARVNLLKDTDSINYGPNWFAVGTGPAITPKQLAPDGTMTASKLVFSATGQNNRLVQNAEIPSTGYGTASIYMRGEVGGEVIGFWNGQVINNRYTLTTEWVRYVLPAQASGFTVPSINILLYAVSGTPTIYVANPQTDVALPSTTTATRYQAVYARRNLLTYTEDCSNAAWAKTRLSVVGNAAVAPDGTMTADKLVEDTSNNSRNMTQLCYTAGIASATGSVFLKAGERGYAMFRVIGSADGTQVTGNVGINLTTGEITGTNGTLNSFGVESAGNGWWRVYANTNQSTTNRFDLQVFVANAPLTGVGLDNPVYQSDGVSGIYVWGGQVETAPTATDYQRIDASQHHLYDYTGFPIGLKFDGVDDFMSTGNIDFSGTDKVALWAGVTKVDDTVRIVAELSEANNAGSFYMVAGEDAGFSQAYSSLSSGSAPRSAGQIAGYMGVPAPDTAALTITHDISGDLSTIKRNGVAGTDGTVDKGAGNFGNYPLYIASRAGASLFFNGTIYSLTGVGKLCTPAEITNANKLTAKAAGVTL